MRVVQRVTGVGTGFGYRGQKAESASTPPKPTAGSSPPKAAAAPKAEEPAEEEPESEEFDPADHTIDDVKAYVEANPEEAADILSMEEGGKDRSTLIEWLEHFLDT